MNMDLCGVSVSSPPSRYNLHLFNDSLNDSVGSNSNIADETNDSLSDTLEPETGISLLTLDGTSQH